MPDAIPDCKSPGVRVPPHQSARVYIRSSSDRLLLSRGGIPGPFPQSWLSLVRAGACYTEVYHLQRIARNDLTEMTGIYMPCGMILSFIRRS
jgi:hypothetical protein